MFHVKEGSIDHLHLLSLRSTTEGNQRAGLLKLNTQMWQIARSIHGYHWQNSSAIQKKQQKRKAFIEHELQKL